MGARERLGRDTALRFLRGLCQALPLLGAPGLVLLLDELDQRLLHAGQSQFDGQVRLGAHHADPACRQMLLLCEPCLADPATRGCDPTHAGVRIT